MWTFKQSTGELFNPDGMLLAEGYSGHGADVDRPDTQSIPDMGPIPEGTYTIGAMELEHPKLGPIVMPLVPDPENEMFNRSGFFLHGDNSKMDESASEGCIILPRFARERVAESADRRLQVVA